MTTTRTVLLTGFGAFPGVPENATAHLVPALAAAARDRHPAVEILHEILPVEWQLGPARLRALTEAHEPAVALHFGVSDRARGFVIETVGRNACRIAEDARGALPALAVLHPDGPDWLASSFPVEAIHARLRNAGLPVEFSEDAGGYLCNAILYTSLAAASSSRRSGFVHVPSGIGAACCPLSPEDAIAGALEILAACLEE